VLPQSRRRKRDHMRQQVASVSGDPLEQAHWGRTTIVIASHRAFKAPIGLLAIRILRASTRSSSCAAEDLVERLRH
jgi:hypothetical protein